MRVLTRENRIIGIINESVDRCMKIAQVSWKYTSNILFAEAFVFYINARLNTAFFIINFSFVFVKLNQD